MTEASYMEGLDDGSGEQTIDEMAEEWRVTYLIAKARNIGQETICPVCGAAFIKKTKAQAFHSIKCKDRYWNVVDEGRRFRASLI